MTRTELSEPGVPDELAGVVHAAAHAAPPYQGDLAVVRGRGRSYRHRRTAAVTGLAALAVAVAIAVPVTISGSASPADGPAGGVAADPPAASPSGTPPPSTNPSAAGPPAQRLLTDVTGWVISADGREGHGPGVHEGAPDPYEEFRGMDGATGVVGIGYAEVQPAGGLIPLELALPGIDSVQDVAAMPDGGLVVLGTLDRMPDATRDDGPCVEGVDFPLLVVAADGSVSASRQVRERCQVLDLVDADGQTAYLVRDSRLVAHDLATGRERLLLDSPGLPDTVGRRAIAGGRLAMLSGGMGVCPGDAPAPLTVRVADLESGAVTEWPVPEISCGTHAGAVRMSPDGRYVAFTRIDDGDVEDGFALRVAVVDLDNGELVVDEQVVAAPEGDSNFVLSRTSLSLTGSAGGIAGIAWDDPRTLRLAWYLTPGEGVHRLADVIEVSTVTIP